MTFKVRQRGMWILSSTSSILGMAVVDNRASVSVSVAKLGYISSYLIATDRLQRICFPIQFSFWINLTHHIILYNNDSLSLRDHASPLSVLPLSLNRSSPVCRHDVEAGALPIVFQAPFPYPDDLGSVAVRLSFHRKWFLCWFVVAIVVAVVHLAPGCKVPNVVSMRSLENMMVAMQLQMSNDGCYVFVGSNDSCSAVSMLLTPSWGYKLIAMRCWRQLTVDMQLLESNMMFAVHLMCGC